MGFQTDYQNVKEHYDIIAATAQQRPMMEMPVATGNKKDTLISVSEMKTNFENAFFFDLSEELTTVLDKTNYSNADRELLKAPFDHMILNIDREFQGQMLKKDLAEERVGENYAPWVIKDANWKVKTVYIEKMEDWRKENMDADEDQTVLMLFSILENTETGKKRDLYEVTGVGDEDWDEPETVNQFVSNIVTNFLLFMNQPEVKYQVRKRDQKNRRKRKKKGKRPLPNDAKVQVSGEIERYLEKVKEAETDIEHEHRYWVRGHWRVLRDEDHWGDKAGEKVWVKPHIRGEGPLIEKDYELN